MCVHYVQLERFTKVVNDQMVSLSVVAVIKKIIIIFTTFIAHAWGFQL